MSNAAKIANWKASPLPYCITSYQRAHGEYRPMGKRRYATPEAALADAVRLDRSTPRNGHMLFVDFAGAYEGAASVGGARQSGEHKRAATAEPRAVLESRGA